MIGVEMQVDPRFDLKLVAVGAALEDAAILLALYIARKEQQQLLVQEPGWATEDATFTISRATSAERINDQCIYITTAQGPVMDYS